MKILLDMFNRNNQLFYKSKTAHPFKPLPDKTFASFPGRDFTGIRKRRPFDRAKKISGIVSQFRTWITLLRFLIIIPVSKILCSEYMIHQRFPSGWIQYAQNKLEKCDLIEKHDNSLRTFDSRFNTLLMDLITTSASIQTYRI
jgi:hypothetical protein